MRAIQDLIKNVCELTEPELWGRKVNIIAQENRYLKKLLNSGEYNIYGTNTLTGHRDDETVTKNNIGDLIKSHKIGGGPYYSKLQTKFITFAKIYSWCAGMTGVSPELFKVVSKLAIEPNFSSKIPMGCSYSSGDVIPATHWAADIIQEFEFSSSYSISNGDIMPLINGNFIQVGYAASLATDIKKNWIFFIEISSLVHNISNANSSNLFYNSNQQSSKKWVELTVNYIKNNNNNSNKVRQDSVSFRALPQLIETFCDAIYSFFFEIDSLLNIPSGNPLFDESKSYGPISQASFLAPSLAIKTSSLIESVLFLMWAIVNRTSYLLSGEIEHIPRDASNANSRLGLIQVPKLMMSILENARTLYGRRAFSSGSQTSYGIEDLWTNGVTMLTHVDALLNDFTKLCSYELYVINYIAESNNYSTLNDKYLIKNTKSCESPGEILEVINNTNVNNFKELSKIFVLNI